jgi:hypothetical protein
MVVQLQADGDARWRVTATFDLATANETEAFRRLATEFEAGEASPLGLPAFRSAAAATAEATGREMRLTDLRRSSAPNETVANGTGRLTLSFTWTNFAQADGDRIVVDDAFRTESGTWLPGLESDQRLVVRPPPGYGVFDASQVPQNGTLEWTGPTTFGPGSLSATFTGANGGPGTQTPTGPDGPVLGMGPLVFLTTVAVGAGAVLAYALVRRRDISVPTVSSEETSETPPPDTDPADGDAGGDGGKEEAVAEELLSDEERVELLLSENGGRMKQANIVKETGWSNAKVSQLLSKMADEGRVDKLRIGRENLISFPEEDVTDFDDR